VPDTTARRGALEGLLKPGRYPGAGGGAFNLAVQERPNVTQLQVIARKDQGASLARRFSSLLGIGKALAPLESAAAEGIQIYATGPLDYWLFSERHSAQALERRLADKLGDTASLFDQSHARFVVRISGDDATRLLAKGTPLDLEAGALPAHGASHTMLEHIPALVVRCASPVTYDLSVPCSYAGSFMAWLGEAALDINTRYLATARPPNRQAL